MAKQVYVLRINDQMDYCAVCKNLKSLMREIKELTDDFEGDYLEAYGHTFTMEEIKSEIVKRTEEGWTYAYVDDIINVQYLEIQ